MKPVPKEAMQILIHQIRRVIPFNAPESSLCTGPCQGCSKKLIEYLDSEICFWQLQLNNDIVPKLGDINKLARTAKKIKKVLTINGFIN
ncbi:MAG: hypothetical protein COW84_01980 [Gammaproteobacteria bacterium CG22_combo_CG10-13_8_21_14_all_40_8]|nr:MAG: hypothetical protein COW84_01980 [Gammaproteobacteria bacterium CG22_combo_CG10-13_8_21_14_all_40_8]